MLKKVTSDKIWDWDTDTTLPYLLITFRKVPQAAAGFSPFELVFAWQVRGPFNTRKEEWEAS